MLHKTTSATSCSGKKGIDDDRGTRRFHSVFSFLIQLTGRNTTNVPDPQTLCRKGLENPKFRYIKTVFIFTSGPDRVLRVEYNSSVHSYSVIGFRGYMYLIFWFSWHWRVINEIRTTTQINMNDRENKVEEPRTVYRQYELETTITRIYKKTC